MQAKFPVSRKQPGGYRPPSTPKKGELSILKGLIKSSHGSGGSISKRCPTGTCGPGQVVLLTGGVTVSLLYAAWMCPETHPPSM